MRKYKNNSINNEKWIFVKKWGKKFIAPKNYPYWIFEYSLTPKKYYIYMPELKVYRCNVSAL